MQELPAAQPSPSPVASPATRHAEEGRPLSRLYPPSEYGGGAQNWAFVQDARGVIYVGSGGGVLEFDGTTWRLIETPLRQTVRSLAIAADGRIYVGSVSDLGYLAPDAAGTLAFVSLHDKIPAEAQRYGDVWRTFALADGVYFQTDSAIFRYADNAMRVWKPAARFNRSSVVDGLLHVSQPDMGLTVLDNGVFRILPGTTVFGAEPYPVVLRYDQRRLLLGSRTEGLFLYDGTGLTPFRTEVDDLIRGSLYRGLVMPDGNIVLTTTQSGAVLIDRDGRRLQVLSRAQGLPSDTVYYPFVDRDSGLWLGMGGIVRVETPSPISFFDPTDGVIGGPQRLHRHDGRLYIATGNGVFVLRPATATTPARFVPVNGMRDQAWWFASIPGAAPGDPGTLLLAGSTGLYRIDGEKIVPVKAPPDGSLRAAVLQRSTVDPARVWVGLFDGLTSFRQVNGEWVDEGRIPGVTEQIRTLHERPDGSLWAGTQATGVIRVRWSDRPAPLPALRPTAMVDRFGEADGISTGFVSVQAVDGEPYFGAITKGLGVFQFDEAANRFVRVSEFDGIGTDMRDLGFGLIQGPDGLLYVNFGKEIVVMRHTADGGWSRDTAAFARFLPFGSPTSLLAEADGTVWIPVGLQVLRFDNHRARPMEPPPTPIMRRITVNRDRLLYGGLATSSETPRLASADNALRFQFAAPQFPAESATEFQTRLDGLDPDWSAWTSEARRDYTNLGFGDFTFRVRARNLAGQVSAGGDLRLCHPAAVVSHVVGVCGLPSARRAAHVDRRPHAAAARDRQGARALADCRGASSAPRPPRRWRKSEERGQEEHRAAERHRPRDHRRRSTSKRSSASSTSASTSSPTRTCSASGSTIPTGRRSSTASRSRRASATRRTRATPATATSCRSGASTTASRSSSTTSQPSTGNTSAATTSRAARSRTARCRSRRSRSSTCR